MSLWRCTCLRKNHFSVPGPPCLVRRVSEPVTGPEPLIVAIDGRSAGSKTTLATRLSEKSPIQWCCTPTTSPGITRFFC